MEKKFARCLFGAVLSVGLGSKFATVFIQMFPLSIHSHFIGKHISFVYFIHIYHYNFFSYINRSQVFEKKTNELANEILFKECFQKIDCCVYFIYEKKIVLGRYQDTVEWPFKYIFHTEILP